MELNKIYKEPCLTTLSKMDNESIDCVITSPPYWQLRDYGYTGQWGLEPTFQKYLEHLWQMMDEVYRVLKPTGTAWINLGDSYYGSGHGQNSRFNKGEITHLDKYYGDGRNTSPVTDWDYSKMKPKTLILIPHRFAIGCIDRGWIMRNDCIWAKRNGMPESVTDRFGKKHEYFFFMVKSEKYYFNLDAIRDKSTTTDKLRNKSLEQSANAYLSPLGKGLRPEQHPLGKNPGSVSDFWDIPTKPSSEKHYASYNDSLLVKPVLSGCPKGGIIYDPFMGTGSTAEVAIRSHRKFIGSEMSKEYCDIAQKRIQPYLDQQTLF